MFAASYAGHVADAVAGLPADAAELARQSLAGAGAIARSIGGEAGTHLLVTAQPAFVDAMAITSLAGVGVALVGALVALAYLPARARATGEERGQQAVGAAA